jgi:hypothetical protein
MDCLDLLSGTEHPHLLDAIPAHARAAIRDVDLGLWAAPPGAAPRDGERHHAHRPAAILVPAWAEPAVRVLFRSGPALMADAAHVLLPIEPDPAHRLSDAADAVSDAALAKAGKRGGGVDTRTMAWWRAARAGVAALADRALAPPATR